MPYPEGAVGNIEMAVLMLSVGVMGEPSVEFAEVRVVYPVDPMKVVIVVVLFG